MDDEDDCAHCECMHCSGPSGPCAVCELDAKLRQCAAELRWCDAERRLALRALDWMSPVCCTCTDRFQTDGEGYLAQFEYRQRLYCAAHAPLHATPLPYAAQIAAADEETR